MITRTRTIILPDWAGKPVEEEQSGWPVIAKFEPSGGECEVGLTDLSHRPKAIVQGAAVKKLGALKPGQAKWNGQAFAGCLKPQEAIIFDLTGPVEPEWMDTDYTEMTEGWILLGVWGPKSLEVIQRLLTVDVERPEMTGPLYLATSCHGIPVQLINMKGASPGFCLACPRSHGQNLFDACIRAGRHFDLKIKGTNAFYDWFGVAGFSDTFEERGEMCINNDSRAI